MPAKSKTAAASDSWLIYVVASGDTGRSWAEEYRGDESRHLERLGIQSLEALRLGQLEHGKEILDRLERGIQQGKFHYPSILHVHNRWFYGVRAYYEYCNSDLDAAEWSLQKAHSEICAAIEKDSFLVLLANHCQEFRLHQARIARGRPQWSEVRRYVHEAWKMMEGILPLCVLSSGQPIYMSNIKRFYDSLKIDDGEQGLRTLFDKARRREIFERFVESLYVLPGFVIAYSSKKA